MDILVLLVGILMLLAGGFGLGWYFAQSSED